ncbi:hypothetical protein [Calothrix sp. NIES-3974]
MFLSRHNPCLHVLGIYSI